MNKHIPSVKSGTARGSRWLPWVGVVALIGFVALLSVGCELETGERDKPESSSGEQAESGASTESAATGEQAEQNDRGEQTIYAQQLNIDNSEHYGERFSGSGCETMPLEDGQQGWVSNPDNIRGTLKFVFPTSYANDISRVTVFTSDGVFFDEFYRQKPDEHDGRHRYYGTKPIHLYPANLYLRVLMKDGTCRSLQHPNPQQRYT